MKYCCFCCLPNDDYSGSAGVCADDDGDDFIYKQPMRETIIVLTS